MSSQTNDQIIRDFCDAWGAGDVAAIVGAFADDAVYHNIPMEPIEGKDAIAAVISAFLTGNRIVFETLRQVASGNVVMNERIDHLSLGDGPVIALPVMGTFELAGGKITAWRDYFDLATFTGAG